MGGTGLTSLTFPPSAAKIARALQDCPNFRLCNWAIPTKEECQR